MKKAFAVLFLAAFAYTSWRLASVQRPSAPPPVPGESVHPAMGRFTAITPTVGGVWLGDQYGQLVHLEEGRTGANWVAHGGPVRRLLVTPKGLVSVGGGSVAQWGTDGSLLQRTRARSYGLNDGLISDTGAILVATERGMVARLDATDPWRIAGYHGRAAFSLALSPQGTEVASGGADGRIAVWSVAADVDNPTGSWRSGGRWVTGLAWTGPSDDRAQPRVTGLISAVQGGQITLWRRPGRTVERRIDCGLDEVIELAVLGSRFVAGSESGKACSGDFAKDAPPRVWSVSADPVIGLAMTPERIFTSGPPGVVYVWDVTKGDLVATLEPDLSRSPP